MEIYTKVYASSYELDKGALYIPQLPTTTKVSFDLTLFNTIYNIPADTSFEFKGSGSFVAYTISAGQYSLASICATMKTIMSAVVSDIDLYSDPLTKKLIMVSPTIATAALRFTLSSQYLLSLLGVDATTYTGSLVTGTRVMMLYPGTGIYAEITGIPYATPPVMMNSSRGSIFLPWVSPGDVMINDDRDTPRVYSILPSQSIAYINVRFYDAFSNVVVLNGGPFTLCMNLLNGI